MTTWSDNASKNAKNAEYFRQLIPAYTLFDLKIIQPTLI